MQYTANANKLIWYILIPLVFIFYAYFLFWSETTGRQNSRDVYVTAHRENMENIKGIDGFILGGSNAAAGISAAIIAEVLDQEWYNLSLSDEGSSDKEYWNFVKTSTSDVNREKVQTVVYSSATVLRENAILERNSYIFKLMSSRLTFLVPSQSIASRMKVYLMNGDVGAEIYTMSRLGDRDLRLSKCGDSGLPRFSINNKETNNKQLSEWVLSQLKALKGLFPSAEIVFVLPSEFYSNIDFKRSIKNAEIINAAISIFRSNNDTIVTLVNQPPYPSIDMLCNDGLHPNPRGRVWRTNNLLDSFSSIK